jgi:endonuclease-8
VPEGQVAHYNAAQLSRLAGYEVRAVDSPQPRAARHDFERRLCGDRIAAARALGKHHLLEFDSGRVLHSHLRMSGRWRVLDPGRRASRANLWLALHTDAGTAALYRCPAVRLLEPHEPLPAPVAALGPDLLDPAIDPGSATARALSAANPSRAVGEALLDQRLVSGVGNAYKAEALFLARVSPWRPLADLTASEAEEIGRVSSELLANGVRQAGRIQPYRAPSGHQGKWVYRRAGRPCRDCGTPIVSRGQGDANRTAYWCPRCQP